MYSKLAFVVISKTFRIFILLIGFGQMPGHPEEANFLQMCLQQGAYPLSGPAFDQALLILMEC